MPNIAYVGAHIDDAELWAGGTLLKYVKNGDKVSILIKETEDQVRKKEQEDSCKLSGFEAFYYSTSQELREKLNLIIPDILITHWNEDSHPDHRQASSDVLNAIKQCRMRHKKPGKFYFCDTYNKIGLYREFSPTKYVDISSVIEDKRRIIMPFKSQNPDFYIGKIELLTRLYGSRCQCEHAEGFREFSYLGSGFAADSL